MLASSGPIIAVYQPPCSAKMTGGASRAGRTLRKDNAASLL